MTIDEILAELSQRKGYFPKAAVEAAVEQQESITPYLLSSLEKAAEPDIQDEANDDLVLFALFLLAQFREPQAYPLIVNMISQPADEADYLLGDITTEGLDRILASVFNGDLQPLKSVIENERVYEFVRGAALRTVAALYQIRELDRSTVLQYFSDLYRGKLKREENHIWGVLAETTGELAFSELADDARQAMNEGLVDDFYYRISDLDEDLQKYATKPRDTDKDILISDTVAELQHWYAFQPKPEKRPEPKPRPEKRFIHAGGTLVNETPKIGRNDPCPCGSGKKFKKCCGR